MKRFVFDTENDNLLREVKTFHCAGIKDATTGEEFWYEPHQLNEFLDKLDEADVIAAHNAVGYDVPALKKLSGGWEPKAKVTCTKVLSQFLNYSRFSREDPEYQRYLAIRSAKIAKEGKTSSFSKLLSPSGHSLGRWGLFLNNYKGDFHDFSVFTPKMFQYMKQDVRLGTEVYNYLLKELQQHVVKYKNKKIFDGLQVEHDLEEIMVEQSELGWRMDKPKLSGLCDVLLKEITHTETKINPLLLTYTQSEDTSTKKLNELRNVISLAKQEGKDINSCEKVKSVDQVFTKKGVLRANVANYFGLDPDTTIDVSPVIGPYTRVNFKRGDVNNTDQVKDYLLSIGWEPDDWNWEKVGREFVKKSSKLSESSLEPLGEVGALINDFYTLRSRYSIISNWENYIDEDDRLHGDYFNIGTPTFRQTHNVIANLPSGNAKFGPEIRSAFIVKDGFKLVSGDSAACQLRLLAYYMKDPKFIREVLEGDVHQMNADIIECSRSQAKRFIFAYLYGAQARKLSGYIGKTVEETKLSIERYKKKLPKLQKLIDDVNHQVNTRGFILGLDSRPVYLPKTERHKALNYLIQSAEAIIMKATVSLMNKRFKEANIEFNNLLFYHDEHTVEVREDQVDLARQIMIKSFEDAPKNYGIPFMSCGDCKIGNDYYEVH